MQHKKIWILLILIVIISCSQKNEAIVKRDHSPEVETNTPELIEQRKEDRKEQQIIFSLPYEQITIDLAKIPILKEYLQWVNRPEEAVKKMNLIPIKSDEQTIYVLEFSCKNNYCSYLLLKEKDDLESHLVADMAQFKQSFLSPDREKILLQFQRIENFTLPLSNLIAVDLKEWNFLPLKPDENSLQQTILPYKWPIIDVIWNDNETLSVYIPDLLELTDANIEQWKKTGKVTKEIIFHLEK